MRCPDEETLALWREPQGQLQFTPDLQHHISSCRNCAERLTLRAELAIQVPEDAPHEFIRGSMLGRYLILGTLGHGGMGDVYLAEDPELGREVAIKVIKKGKASSPTEGVRLLREAQAMARLSHPNVLPIYDVGVFDGRAFLAMERVQGCNLRQWLFREKRHWREIVKVFVDAGRGLEAAHAAGLVHRDFKPDNVLIGEDKRVRVTDFGLARIERLQESSSEQTQTATPRAGLLDVALTEEGATQGTPAYMAPEQRVGVSDARADQYGFCVALYEALARALPPKDNQPGVKSSEWRAPLRIRRVVERGLSRDPAWRWPSMSALLAALEERAGLGLKQLLLTAALGIGLLSWVALRTNSQCVPDEDLKNQVWSGARRKTLQAAFMATGLSDANSSWVHASRRVDDFVNELSAQGLAVCKATQGKSDPSADPRLRCIDDRKKELASLLALWVSPDVSTVRRAVDAAASLRRSPECTDISRLTEQPLLPRDSPFFERAELISQQLVQAKALQISGRYGDAARVATEALSTARTLSYPPLLALALSRAGTIQILLRNLGTAQDLLVAALREAESARLDYVRVEVVTGLIQIAAYQDDYRGGMHWVELGQGIVRRVGADEYSQGQFEGATGLFYARAGKIREAREHLLKAQKLYQSLSEPLLLARTLTLLGQLENLAGRPGEAANILRDALDSLKTEVSPVHPLLATAMYGFAEAVLVLGHAREALTLCQSALEIQSHNAGAAVLAGKSEEVCIGKSMIALGMSQEAVLLLEKGRKDYEQVPESDEEGSRYLHRYLSIALSESGRVEDARRLLQPMIANRREHLPERENELGQDLWAFGRMLIANKEFSRAVEALQEARTHVVHHGGNDNLPSIIFFLARAHAQLGQQRQALALFKEAVSLMEEKGGPAQPALAESLAQIGQIHLRMHREDLAAIPLRRALLLAEQGEGNPKTLARLRTQVSALNPQ